MQFPRGIELRGHVEACVDVLPARGNAAPAAPIRGGIKTAESLKVNCGAPPAARMRPVIAGNPQMCNDQSEHLVVCILLQLDSK